jgi:hypothetical protein
MRYPRVASASWLVPGAGYCLFEQLPAFTHPAGEDQHRSERRGGVESCLVITDSLALRAAAFPVGDGLLQAVVHQVGSSHCGVQPGTLTIRSGHRLQAVQRRLQCADAGIKTGTEQVRDRDHARHQRGRRAHIAGRSGQLMGRPVRLGGGGVVVGGRGLVAERGEQPGLIRRRKLGRQVAHRPAAQLEGLAMGR